MNDFSTTSSFAPDTEYSCMSNEVFTPNDPVSFAIFGSVAPASPKIPTGEILLDGSINFKSIEQSETSIKTDSCGRVVEIASSTGARTDLGYNQEGSLAWLKQSDGDVLTKNDQGWVDGHTCWTAVVPLLDGTLWCKKSNNVIVQKYVDGSYTWHDLRRKFILWFDANKRIVGIRYPNGQNRAFAYDARGICKVTEPDGSEFVLKNRVWESERDSSIQLSDLTLSQDGTLTYRIGNYLMSTTASGKLSRTMLQGETTPSRM